MDDEKIVILSEGEIEKMRRVGRLAADLLNHLEPMAVAGTTTQQINDEAEKWTRARGAKSGPLGYHGFTRSICTSINEVVCHGIPDPKTVLKNGDIINIDVTPILDGYFGDTSKTFLIGNCSAAAKQLVEVTRECLRRGILEVAPGKRIGDIGAAIQEHAEEFGYGVVKEFVGHGVGKIFHCAPQVPHFGERGKGRRLQAGMAFTIEPMINIGHWKTKVLKDGWTAITKDGSLSAQFEHTIVVTPTGVEILTLSEGETFL